MQPPRRTSNLVENRHRLLLEQFLTRHACQIADHDPAAVIFQEGVALETGPPTPAAPGPPG